jgi:hypothetical protein
MLPGQGLLPPHRLQGRRNLRAASAAVQGSRLLRWSQRGSTEAPSFTRGGRAVADPPGTFAMLRKLRREARLAEEEAAEPPA